MNATQIERPPFIKGEFRCAIFGVSSDVYLRPVDHPGRVALGLAPNPPYCDAIKETLSTIPETRVCGFFVWETNAGDSGFDPQRISRRISNPSTSNLKAAAN